MTSHPRLPDVTRLPLPVDVDAIAGRALAAPAGDWTAFPDSLLIPWRASTDDQPYGQWDQGRLIGVIPGDWHAGGRPAT